MGTLARRLQFAGQECPSSQNAELSLPMIATAIVLLVVLAVGSFRTAYADEPRADKSANSQPAETADVNATSPNTTPLPSDPEPVKKTAAPVAPISPEKFRDVDDAAKLLIWLVVSCGLGLLVLLCVIVLGAKRMRRLTRSQMLKSKYDELEFLRLKHRREADGLTAPESPKTEIR